MPTRSRFRLQSQSGAAVLALTVVVLIGLMTAAASAQSKPKAEAVCSGRNMIAELEKADAAAHAKLVEAAKAIGNTEALLWKVEKAGATPSYLFGTVHLTDPRATTMPRMAEAALAAAKTVVLELADLSADASSRAMMQSMQLVVYSDGRRLDTLLSPQEFETAKSALAATGLPAEAAAMFKPWIIYMMMSVSPCERRKTAEGKLVLDATIAAKARSRGVPVLGLETIDEQFSALAGVPDDQQLQMLRGTLKYGDRVDDLMETVLQLYLTRQMGMTWPFQLMLAEKAGIDPAPYEEFRQRLVVKRNLHMRDGALPILAKGGAFIGVGALHLPGKEGLVNLLREAGYTVTAVE